MTVRPSPGPDGDVLASWSPRYHVTAERHWLNDPNGLIQVSGTYHVFFQENPDAPFWGSPHWGHVSSEDLVSWRRHERALSPGQDGPDQDGCWSGCARIVDGTVCLYYTGVAGDGLRRVESVCRATGSPDLSRWTRDPRNPLIAGPPAEASDDLPSGQTDTPSDGLPNEQTDTPSDGLPNEQTATPSDGLPSEQSALSRVHRDPFLWRDGRGWHLVLASWTEGDDRHSTQGADRHSTQGADGHRAEGADGHGAVLVYDSPDAVAWRFAGILFEDDDPPDGGPRHWECVQLVPFPEATVLIVSVQLPLADRPLNHVEYIVGDLDGNRFRARRRGRLDGGDALYAPAVMVDEQGRRLLWGWAQEALDPAVQERLPVAGALTLPRMLSLDGDVLGMLPVPELVGLRDRVLLDSPADGIPRALPAGSGRQVEIETGVLPGSEDVLDLRLASAVADTELRVTVSPGDRLEVTVTGPDGRRRSSRVPLSRPHGGALRVYRDGSLVEVLHDGQAVTTRWYAALADDWTVALNGPEESRMTAWALRDAFG
jgi:beta-fructofuranosidase